VIGYLKEKNYLDYSKNEINLYKTIKKNTQIAIENAAWLRNQVVNDLPIWNKNPYTDVDCLVKCLLDINENIFWTTYDKPIEVQKNIVTFYREGAVLKIDIKNGQGSPILINKDKVRLKGNEDSLLEVKTRIIRDSGVVEINVDGIEGDRLILSLEISSQNIIRIEL